MSANNTRGDDTSLNVTANENVQAANSSVTPQSPRKNEKGQGCRAQETCGQVHSSGGIRLQSSKSFLPISRFANFDPSKDAVPPMIPMFDSVVLGQYDNPYYEPLISFSEKPRAIQSLMSPLPPLFPRSRQLLWYQIPQTSYSVAVPIGPQGYGPLPPFGRNLLTLRYPTPDKNCTQPPPPRGFLYVEQSANIMTPIIVDDRKDSSEPFRILQQLPSELIPLDYLPDSIRASASDTNVDFQIGRTDIEDIGYPVMVDLLEKLSDVALETRDLVIENKINVTHRTHGRFLTMLNDSRDYLKRLQHYINTVEQELDVNAPRDSFPTSETIANAKTEDIRGQRDTEETGSLTTLPSIDSKGIEQRVIGHDSTQDTREKTQSLNRAEPHSTTEPEPAGPSYKEALESKRIGYTLGPLLADARPTASKPTKNLAGSSNIPPTSTPASAPLSHSNADSKMVQRGDVGSTRQQNPGSSKQLFAKLNFSEVSNSQSTPQKSSAKGDQNEFRTPSSKKTVPRREITPFEIASSWAGSLLRTEKSATANSSKTIHDQANEEKLTSCDESPSLVSVHKTAKSPKVSVPKAKTPKKLKSEAVDEKARKAANIAMEDKKKRHYAQKLVAYKENLKQGREALAKVQIELSKSKPTEYVTRVRELPYLDQCVLSAFNATIPKPNVHRNLAIGIVNERLAQYQSDSNSDVEMRCFWQAVMAELNESICDDIIYLNEVKCYYSISQWEAHRFDRLYKEIVVGGNVDVKFEVKPKDIKCDIPPINIAQFRKFLSRRERWLNKPRGLSSAQEKDWNTEFSTLCQMEQHMVIQDRLAERFEPLRSWKILDRLQESCIASADDWEDRALNDKLVQIIRFFKRTLSHVLVVDIGLVWYLARHSQSSSSEEQKLILALGCYLREVAGLEL